MHDRELIYRLRTCAAALTSGIPTSPQLHADASTLLNEAAGALEAFEADPAPEVQPPQPELPAPAAGPAAAVWGGVMPPPTGEGCPRCGSVTARTVHRDAAGRRRLMLTCPVCSQQWEYGRGATP